MVSRYMDKFKINRKSSISSFIVENVITNINDGVLRAGDTLPTEMDLAESYGVSRNTVREALRVLETYGVVETSHRKQPRIVDNNLEASIGIATIQFSGNKSRYREIQQIRKLMELGLVESIASRVTNEHIHHLQMINDKISKSESIANLAKLDFEFHTYLVSLAGNSIVEAIYSSLSATIIHILELGKNLESGINEAREGHEKIISSLKSGQTDVIYSTMSEHFNFVAEILEE